MQESFWSKYMKESIESIPVVRYKNPSLDNKRATGVTKDIYFKDELILPSNNDEQISICSGVQLEAFVGAVDKYPELRALITPEDMKELIKWAYVYEGPEDDKKKYADGLPGGLVKLGIAKWIDPYEVEYGDIAQIQGISFNEAYDDGHAVIVESLGKKDEKPVLWCWSSSPTTNGVGRDWFWIYKSKNGIERQWKIARPIIP